MSQRDQKSQPAKADRSLLRRLGAKAKARTTAPLVEPDIDERSELERYFNPEFYLAANPDVADSEFSPLDHYLENGWLEGRDPSTDFSTSFYLSVNSDVAASGMNPLVHYVRHGQHEGRQVQQDIDTVAELDGDLNQRVKQAFDRSYYLTAYPDVAESGHDPLDHYLRHGAAEGRNPTSDFSTDYYRQMNPDVEAAGVNPFVHFVLQGQGEGRLGRSPGGWKVDALMKTTPDLIVLTDDSDLVDLPELPIMEADGLRRGVDERRQHDRLLIAVAHSDHRAIPGGVQLCMELEEQLAGERGFDYLAIRPVRAMPRLSLADDPLIAVKLNGIDIAVARSSAFTAMLTSAESATRDDSGSAQLARGGRPLSESPLVVVHCMLGHSPEALGGLTRAASECILWLHDFSALCGGYTLLRNGVSYCGAPSVESNACSICVHGQERDIHIRRMRGFFGDSETTVIAPSESAAAVWASSSDRCLDHSPTAIPHLTMRRLEATGPSPEVSQANPLKVAFVGTPAAHKGWNEFVELANALVDYPQIEFHAFSSSIPSHETIVPHTVHVRANDIHAVRDALIAADIDLVLHWAIWPETFGFSACEAIASGATLITNPDSGNVATLARAHGGIVFDNLGAVKTFLRSGEAEHQLTRRRQAGRVVSDFVTSDFSFAALKAVTRT